MCIMYFFKLYLAMNTIFFKKIIKIIKNFVYNLDWFLFLNGGKFYCIGFFLMIFIS